MFIVSNDFLTAGKQQMTYNNILLTRNNKSFYAFEKRLVLDCCIGKWLISSSYNFIYLGLRSFNTYGSNLINRNKLFFKDNKGRLPLQGVISK